MRATHRRGGVAGCTIGGGRAAGLDCLPGAPASRQPDSDRNPAGHPGSQQAHDKIRAAGVTLHNPELVRLEGIPAMFSFADPDGNGLVYLEDGEPRP